MYEIFFDIPFAQDEKINLVNSKFEKFNVNSFVSKLELIFHVSIILKRYNNKNFKIHPESRKSKNCFTIHLKVIPLSILELTGFTDKDYIKDVSVFIGGYLFSDDKTTSQIEEIILHVPSIVLHQEEYQKHIIDKFE